MYTRFAREYETAISDNIYNAHLERPTLLSMIPELKGLQVLDLGCGPGLYIEHFLDQGAQVTGIDRSSEMIARVSERFRDAVTCYTQDLSDGLPEEHDKTYDLVISPLTLHYIEDWTLILADIRRVLKNDGCFVFSTHHPLLDFEPSPSSNYFKRELIVEQWDTIGQPVEVQFYRRPLSELFMRLSKAGLYVADLQEGKPSARMKSIDSVTFEHLSRNPKFIFFKCRIAP